jgi:integrase
MFRHADDLGFWRGPLPTERLKLPKLVRVRESRALTEEQVAAILEHLEGQERLLVMTLFFTGMRVGEALALDWCHVNMSDKPMTLGRESIPAHTIAVRRNWSVGQFKESPKTPSGRRNIPIHASLWVALMAVRREAGLVFPGPTGTKPMDAHNIANRSLKRAGEALGLGRIGFHVFRHTLASLAQAHGMTVGEVRGVLGHASAATSMLYVHGDAERARKVIEEIGGKVN